MSSINVTQTYLPKLEDYHQLLERIWNNKWLTNRGLLVQELENSLKSFLGVDFLTLTTNGTLPLQIAIKALGLNGEIITTPFSYIATTASIVWENCTPVFVDIHPDYLSIDESKIEAAITDKTVAILATHVFGNPCEVEVINELAKKHNLKVIYDGAHSFGVEYKNKGIFNYGDVNTCSFHATKLFHTGEGGCWTTNNKELQQTLFYHHNFGHNGQEAFHGLGINAKMSELQAAMGLAIFPDLHKIIFNRKEIVTIYNQNLNFLNLKTIKIREKTNWNYSYYPVIFNTEETLLEIQKQLNLSNIFPRRYFYPSLNTIPYISGEKMPISESTASRILCLPLYVGLESFDLERIIKIINQYSCL